jgi:hypothetical protein
LKKYILIFVFGLAYTKCNAQIAFMDTIAHALKGERRAYIGFHNRNTFILSERTRLFGVVGGFDFNEQVKLYAGLYGFGQADETLLTGRLGLTTDTAYRFTSTSNFSLGIDYDFFEWNRISLSVPLQVGIGNVSYDYTKIDRRTPIRTNNFRVVPIETGINAYYELLPWAGIRAGLGYRLNIGKKEVRRLSSPYYNLGLSILLKPLYHDIREALAE